MILIEKVRVVRLELTWAPTRPIRSRLRLPVSPHARTKEDRGQNRTGVANLAGEAPDHSATRSKPL